VSRPLRRAGVDEAALIVIARPFARSNRR